MAIVVHRDNLLSDLCTGTGIAISAGFMPGLISVNPRGRTLNADSGVLTDIWDHASQPVWLPPTEARIHQLTSSSTSDDAAGVGARTVRVSGLPAWDKREVSQTLAMNGTSDVATDAFVIIHKLEVITNGPTSVNVGLITATADTDATVTAQIRAGAGRSQMAIYGVPSIQTCYLIGWTGSAIKSTAGISVSNCLLLNNQPDQNSATFGAYNFFGLETGGTNNVDTSLVCNDKIDGPLILKAAANSSANNSIIGAGFSLVIADAA